MNIDNNNQETLKAPNEDIQERQYEILSPIHIFTPQQQQRLNQDELCAISSGITSPVIDQYHERYSQQQVNDYEIGSDGDIKWLEDEYKEYIKQIEHMEESKQEEEQQYQLKLSKQLEDQEQWEEMLLQNLIALSEKQSNQDLYQSQQENNPCEYLQYLSRHNKNDNKTIAHNISHDLLSFYGRTIILSQPYVFIDILPFDLSSSPSH
ncbi:unnamed protein product [Adineta steineri]|uniref:Uncharacterized protein n=1 Tax=Adineta steineri TaxID=433720 RepID=A0A819Z4E2_9BILA|nr:unnamed protein product [Adineta steineri]CAF4163124.1 unnamed protein product [Adineta steineri]